MSRDYLITTVDTKYTQSHRHTSSLMFACLLQSFHHQFRVNHISIVNTKQICNIKLSPVYTLQSDLPTMPT